MPCPAPPSLEEVKAEAVAVGLGVEEGERFWNYWQERDWRRDGGEVVDWKRNLRTWTAKGPPKRAGKASPRDTVKRKRWQIEQDIEASEKRIEELKREREPRIDALGQTQLDGKLKPEALEKMTREKGRRQKLKDEFDNADE